MKILLGHNFYRSSSPSGEDAVYLNERALLLEHAEVVAYERYSDDINATGFMQRLHLAGEVGWSRQTYQEISALIEQEQPDLAHFHNTFPLISPSAFAACRAHGVPVVLTIHNYRLVCANAFLMRQGEICEKCLGGNLLPALWYRCYRNSLPATMAQVWSQASNRWRGSYHRDVDCYIALTQFAADKLIAGGLPAQRFVIKPNFLPGDVEPGNGDGGYVVFVGRLSEEKGVLTLLSAWEQLGNYPLRLVGDGPLRGALEAIASERRLPVTFLGTQAKADVIRIIKDAALLVLPSEWYEGFPMVIIEAFACGTPVVASRIGGVPAIVRDGFNGANFRPRDPDDLAMTLRRVLQDTDLLSSFRLNAYRDFRMQYTPEANIQKLLAIYNKILTSARV